MATEKFAEQREDLNLSFDDLFDTETTLENGNEGNNQDKHSDNEASDSEAPDGEDKNCLTVNTTRPGSLPKEIQRSNSLIKDEDSSLFGTSPTHFQKIKQSKENEEIWRKKLVHKNI